MFDIFLPRNAVLKKYVKYIYVYENLSEEDHFFILPFAGAALTVIENGTFNVTEPSHFTIHKTGTLHSCVQLMPLNPIKVSVTLNSKVIMVVFKPLGINQFIATSLSRFTEAHHTMAIPFPLKYIHKQQLKEMADASFSEKAALMETILLDYYNAYEHSILENAITCLGDVEKDYSIPQVCKLTGTSIRSLNRLFREHVMVSPVQFRYITRFEHSLHLKLKKAVYSVNDIALACQYSDPSYMVRVYKKLSGFTPGDLFQDLQKQYEYHHLFKMVFDRRIEKDQNH